MSPTGRIPFLKAGDFVVAEMEHIVSFVNSKVPSHLFLVAKLLCKNANVRPSVCISVCNTDSVCQV